MWARRPGKELEISSVASAAHPFYGSLPPDHDRG